MFSQGLIVVILVWTTMWTNVSAAVPLCYFPSGEIATENVPCTNGTVSNCCGSTSNCLANGLCLVNTDTDTVEFGRGGCTDPTWASPECFAQCRTTPQGQLRSNGAAVFECDTVGYNSAAEYCCETGDFQKTSCCKTSSLRFALVAGLPTGFQSVPPDSSAAAASTLLFTSTVSSAFSTITLASSSSSTTAQRSTKILGQSNGQSSATSSSSSSKTGSASMNTQTSSPSGEMPSTATSQVGSSASGGGLSETAQIAIGVTVPVGVLLLALLAFLLWNNARNNKKIKTLQSDLDTTRISPPYQDINSAMASYGLTPDNIMKPAAARAPPQYGYPRNEYYKPGPHPAHRVLHEMTGSPDPQELLADVPVAKELELSPISPESTEMKWK